MIRVFIFEDFYQSSYDPLVQKIFKIDINKELEELEKNGWKIKSVQHQILQKYQKNYDTWDKDMFTVVAEKES